METYEAFRRRMQSESPDPDRCEHGIPLRIRCIRCDERDERAASLEEIEPPVDDMIGELLICWDCTRAAGIDIGGDGPDSDALVRPVASLGHVVGLADPTQTYRLSCGHVVI